MREKASIVWFRRDLRIHDHPALWKAISQGRVLPVFIWSPEEAYAGYYGESSSWWLYHSLADLDHSLQQLGSKLILRKGESLSVLLDIIEETDACAVYFNKRYEPEIQKRDQRICDTLEKNNIHVERFESHLLFDPRSILTKTDQPYKVFTSFWRKVRNRPVDLPMPIPTSLKAFQDSVRSERLEDLKILPKIKWYKNFSTHWKPGEKGAKLKWNAFIEEKLKRYSTQRDFPASLEVSQLSPHISWGELSPRWVWHQLELYRTLNSEEMIDIHIDSFKRQLVWREFAYHQLVSFPNMASSPLRKEYMSFPWLNEHESFNKWKLGKTGYPLVDAGMRELWETGWMHNRVRMVAASFLVKHLLISWQSGENWFRETLVDADLANNVMGWQWVTGCGFDAAPYFRIFNPILQGEKYDPLGVYIKKWLPELSLLPKEYIHAPWQAPDEILKSAGIQLGVTYPYPIVDHAHARQRALEAFKMIKH